MQQIGFDNEKYLKMQSEHIQERIAQFDNKLYLELGGKLFDDYHASRVLPGFKPDSKINMLLKLKEQAEIVIVINAADIEKSKVRGDLGITYDADVLRLIDAFRGVGLFVGSVVIAQYAAQPMADKFRNLLEKLGVPVYLHYPIEGYPNNIPLIVSEEGFGKNEYVETSRPLVIVTAPGPGSGKMATCLSQLYHEHKRGVLLNALKALGGIQHDILLISPIIIEPIQNLKTKHLGNHNPRLHSDEVLIALCISAATNPTAELALKQLAKLKGCEAHSSVILSQVDDSVFRKLGMNLTCEARYQSQKLYHK